MRTHSLLTWGLDRAYCSGMVHWMHSSDVKLALSPDEIARKALAVAEATRPVQFDVTVARSPFFLYSGGDHAIKPWGERINALYSQCDT